MIKSAFSILIVLYFFISHSPVVFSEAINPASICLTDCSQIPAEIKAYAQKRPIKTEMDEINYLIYRIRTSNRKFIRNGSEYDSFKAAAFVRFKIGWYQQHFGEKIDDDEKFVAKVLRGSETTGEPYKVVLPDGKRVNLQLVMLNELNSLEAYQGEEPELLASDLKLR